MINILIFEMGLVSFVGPFLLVVGFASVNLEVSNFNFGTP